MNAFYVGPLLLAEVVGNSFLNWLSSFAWWIGIPLAILFVAWLTLRHIPNDQVGTVEKLWSFRGSVPEGNIMALNSEAGYQAELLRGGVHFGFWRWQYKIHKGPLVTIPQGKIGYIYARDGEALPPSQTLARVASSNNFQDARAFLLGTGRENSGREKNGVVKGQRGRQRAILREGVYAINLALFMVITEDAVFAQRSVQSKRERESLNSWHAELKAQGGFSPVVVGASVASVHEEVEGEMVDSIGIVTVHDGPSLEPGEIIAPTVGSEAGAENYHNNFQNPEAFLRSGGRRGRQHMPLTDGTYFINRWFATVETSPKTVVPIGYVGVVVSYYGQAGADVSGTQFRHGERVAEGDRGVWERALGPGKYPFNTYAGSIVLVPTTNFVLHWITGKAESHRYDESLKSIDLVTKDAYEPLLPLSVVVHIDYQRASSVIQRFGDVKRLITQTLDPMLSAYFRDIAHKKTMLQLLHERDQIQDEARAELRSKFHEFDIECVDVLIGKPETSEASGKIETLLDQLRERQLSVEQIETYERKRAAADKLRMLAESQAQAKMQTELTNARVQAQIASEQGEADLARARKAAEQMVVTADAELARSRRSAEQTVVLAEAESRQRELEGRGESQRVMQVGLSEAAVQLRKIASYGDPRLYALAAVSQSLSHSAQPLVPERVFIAGGQDGESSMSASNGMLGTLLSLLVSEKSGFNPVGLDENDPLKVFADKMSAKVMENLAAEEKERSVGSDLAIDR